jgi:hypothetical protein
MVRQRTNISLLLTQHIKVDLKAIRSSKLENSDVINEKEGFTSGIVLSNSEN